MQATRSSHEELAPEAWEATVSLWMDGEGEIRAEDLDTPYGRQVWDTYHLIGDVMRSPDLAVQPSPFFYARLSRAIDEEPAIVAPNAMRWRLPLKAGLSGLAVAAAVVAVAWIAMPYFLAPMAPGEADTPVMASIADEGGWRDYVDAHRDVAGFNALRQASFSTGAPRP